MNAEDNQSVAEVRAKYFSDNGFAEDGGYGARWVPLKFGPIKLALYNSAARKRAIPIHDLHHLVTGYNTDPKGEAEVATWELAAGTHDKWFALFINLPALLYGAALWPRTIWAAWRKGCRETGLYTSDFNAQWLHLNLDQLRRVAFSPKPPPPCIGCKYFGYLVGAMIATVAPLILLAWIVGSLIF